MNGLASPTQEEGGGRQRRGPVFGMAMIFVFLVLAAQYESWAVPFSVLLGLPIGVLGAFIGVNAVGLENNVYVQIGIVTLMGLAAKNAILIVEFAKENHEKGMSLATAATEGAKTPLPAHHDGGACLHSWRHPAGDSERGRRRGSRQHWYRGVLGHADGFHCRPLLYPDALRSDLRAAAYMVTGDRKAIQWKTHVSTRNARGTP